MAEDHIKYAHLVFIFYLLLSNCIIQTADGFHTGTGQITKSQVLSELQFTLGQKERLVQSNPYDAVSQNHVAVLHQVCTAKSYNVFVWADNVLASKARRSRGFSGRITTNSYTITLSRQSFSASTATAARITSGSSTMANTFALSSTATHCATRQSNLPAPPSGQPLSAYISKARSPSRDGSDAFVFVTLSR